MATHTAADRPNLFFPSMRSSGWLFMLWGVAAVIAGILALVWPALSLVTLTIIFGAFAVITGIVEIVHAFTPDLAREARWILGVRGISAIILGLIAFFLPGITLRALVIVIGVYLLILGVLEGITAFRRHFHPGLLVRGIISIIIGIAALVWPGLAILTLGVLFGIYAILAGVTAIAIGWHLQHRTRTA